jgi:hypothetical protein
MRAELEVIKKKFKNKLIGSALMQHLVCEALTLLPKDIVDRVTKTCWFVSSFEDAFGFTLRGDELGGKHLVFLSDDLLSEGRYQQCYTVLHEIGHVLASHRNSILKPQTVSEIRSQEKEADSFAKKYLSDFK